MKKGYIVFYTLILLIVLFKIVDFLFFPCIKLIGESDVKINYREKYNDSGYQVYLRGKKINDKVSKIGIVDSSKLGEYKIIYRLDDDIFSRKVIRKVSVKDLEKPKIVLDSYDDIYLCNNIKENINSNDKKFSKIGTTLKKSINEDTNNIPYLKKATDNYDGNITKRVKFTKTDSFYKYVVSDSSNNKTTIIRNIKYKDIEKPEISLVGGDEVNLHVGDDYKELGYQALDNCDGDITSKVEVYNNVSKNTPGRYEISYKVVDSSNNKTIIKRYVNVSNQLQNGVIYLTFDDGPRLSTTPIILDILKAEDVKATFFVTNNGPDNLIKREFDEGHTVGLHSATHNYAYIYSSNENYFNDLESVRSRVKRITGYDPKLIRFPGGSSNTISRKYKEHIMTELTREVINRGFKYFDWNLNSGDAGETTDKNELIKIVTTHLKKDRPNVILMHDIKPYTRDALKEIIDYGKREGYNFMPLTENDDILQQKVNN